jgi:hypothetical protein
MRKTEGWPPLTDAEAERSGRGVTVPPLGTVRDEADRLLDEARARERRR